MLDGPPETGQHCNERGTSRSHEIILCLRLVVQRWKEVQAATELYEGKHKMRTKTYEAHEAFCMMREAWTGPYLYRL